MNDGEKSDAESENNFSPKENISQHSDTGKEQVDKKSIDNSGNEHTDIQTEKSISRTASYDAKNVHYEGDTAVYTDPETKYQYTWNKEKEEWETRTSNYSFEDDTHTYTDTDGIKFFWDKDRSAWFPKINDDFMAQYQMNYGFIDNTTDSAVKDKVSKSIASTEDMSHSEAQNCVQPKGEKRKPSEPAWFELDNRKNTKVYVSNLPLDITEEEFVELMQKCGLVMKDDQTGKLKIKLYKDPHTDQLKGDGLCTYIRIESVELALKILDGSHCKGKTIHVERAKFQMKGQYDPNLKPKSRKKKEKQKLKKIQDKLFDWRPEKMLGERAQHERIVIVKNLFEPKLFDENVSLILEYKEDLREECMKCGDVRKVELYDRHPEGVAQITMKTPEEADACVTLLNGRWFGKRQITAETWDGKTKHRIAETDSQISERIDKWDKFLEGESEDKNKQDPAKSSPPNT